MKALKYALFASFLIPCNLNAKSADTTTKPYFHAAKQHLENMLNGKEPLSYEEAIYQIENAWWEGKIDKPSYKLAIDHHVKNIGAIIYTWTDSAMLHPTSDLTGTKQQKLERYQRALANYAIFRYMTKNAAFVEGSRIFSRRSFSYLTSDPLGTKDWTTTHITHLLNEHKGNCFALASLYKILSDRLNSDARLCTAPSHIYIRHADEKGTFYNVELSSGSFPGTGTIETLTYTPDEAVKSGISLRELNDRQAVALCLVYLAKGYEYKLGVKDDEFALACAESALQHDANNLNAMLLKAEIMESRLIRQSKDVAHFNGSKELLQYQQWIRHIYKLGYREMPFEMKNLLMKGWTRDTLAMLATTADLKPENTTGSKLQPTRKASLSWGLFDEEIRTKPFERIGNTVFDTRKGTIFAFLKDDILYNQYNFDPVVFAWNVDPLAKSFAGLSPYIFAQNSPISMIDREGKHGEIVVNKGNPSASDPEKRKTTVTASQIYYTTKNRVKGLNGDYSFFDNVKANDIKGSTGGWEQTWNTAKYNVSFNVTVSLPLENEAQLKQNLIDNPVSNYLNIDGKTGSSAGGRFMFFNPKQHSPKNSYSHENGHNWGLPHFPNLVDPVTGIPSIMSYQNNRAVTEQDVTNVVDPAVELANSVSDENVTIHVFANEDANGNISDMKTTYKIYNSSTGTYSGSSTVDRSKTEGAR